MHGNTRYFLKNTISMIISKVKSYLYLTCRIISEISFLIISFYVTCRIIGEISFLIISFYVTCIIISEF